MPGVVLAQGTWGTMRYISQMFVLETLGEIEKPYDLAETSFLNIRIVRDIYIYVFLYI